VNLTDLLDLVGSLLVVVALAVFVAPFSVAGAIGVAGVGLLVLSIVIDRGPTRRRRKKGASS
jgi:hypothetical protein